jgi:hypothetical protein
MVDKNGFYNKYSITRTDGTPINRDEEHFVLKLDSDRFARDAAIYYAQISNNALLESDLRILFKQRGWDFSKLKHSPRVP